MEKMREKYTIQQWLETVPQGYLLGTVYGDSTNQSEPEFILDNDVLLENEIRTTVQIIGGERCALSVSSALVNLAKDDTTKTFLATQTLDEARHVEIFTRRLIALGIKNEDVEQTISNYINPNLVKFADVLMEKVDKGDFAAAIVGQNIMLEGMAFSVFELLEAANSNMNARFASIISGVLADERRHVGFGENYLGSLLSDDKRNKSRIENMQEEMSFHILSSFATSFKHASGAIKVKQEIPKTNKTSGTPIGKWANPGLKNMSVDEIEMILGGTLIKSLKERLNRIGLDYKNPKTPV